MKKILALSMIGFVAVTMANPAAKGGLVLQETVAPTDAYDTTPVPVTGAPITDDTTTVTPTDDVDYTIVDNTVTPIEEEEEDDYVEPGFLRITFDKNNVRNFLRDSKKFIRSDAVQKVHNAK